MIGFIVETERRELFLRRGHSSLFSYCMRELGYSEAQAMLRITAARCIVKFPDVFDLLRADEVNLGTISRVSKILTPDNCADVLNSIRRKSLREVEAIVAEHEPVSAFPKDRVRTIVARVPVGLPQTLGEIHLCNSGKKSTTVEESTLDEPKQKAFGATADDPGASHEGEASPHHQSSAVTATHRLENQKFPVDAVGTVQESTRGDEPTEVAIPSQELEHQESLAEAPAAVHKLEQAVPTDSAAPVHRLERRARIEFTAHQELVEKLERIRAIASHRLTARASMEQLITFMADYVIHREDPVKRHQRRQARQLKAGKAVDDQSTSR